MVSHDLNDMYEEIVMDHYHNPRNTDALPEPDFEVEKNNTFCGDEIKIQILQIMINYLFLLKPKKIML